ncbi:hypothetical protein OAA91_01105 [Fibrobacterales bacterium]|nr:hypothetical protein [Fibrobacterales bacterium]
MIKQTNSHTIFIFILIAFSSLMAGLPPKLPGQEYTPNLKILETNNKKIKYPTMPQQGWKSISVEAQVEADQTLIGIGQGALFIPTMTSPQLEPDVEIYTHKGKFVKTSRTGQRIILDPGVYKIKVGQEESSVEFNTGVIEGQTRVLNVKWGGLVVEVLDNESIHINESYDLYDLEDGSLIGRGYGQEEDRLNNLKTWLLKPGVYKITRSGVTGTSGEYITIRVDEGRMSTVEIIIDTDEELLLGGGELSQKRAKAATRHWHHQVALGGAVSFETKKQNDGTTQKLFSWNSDLRLRSRFDNQSIFGVNETRLRLSMRKEDNGKLIATGDDIYARTLWVRRLTNWVGPYIRIRASSHLVETVLTVEDSTYTFIDENGPGLDVIHLKDEQVVIQPSLSPRILAEGLGVNFDILSGVHFDWNLQSGFAARQLWQDSVWVIANKEGTLWEKGKESFTEGVEVSTEIQVRLPFRIKADFRAGIYSPNASTSFEEIVLEEFSLDLRLGLSKYAELSWFYELEDSLLDTFDENLGGARIVRPSSTLSLRIFLNF